MAEGDSLAPSAAELAANGVPVYRVLAGAPPGVPAYWTSHPELKPVFRALLLTAQHCQGGNSEAGAAAAEALGIPFPLRMETLCAAAARLGFDPDELYPWLKHPQGRPFR